MGWGGMVVNEVFGEKTYGTMLGPAGEDRCQFDAFCIGVIEGIWTETNLSTQIAPAAHS